MNSKIFIIPFVVSLALALYFLPFTAESFPPIINCVNNNPQGTCVSCYKQKAELNPFSFPGSKSRLFSNQENIIVGYVNSCIPYECEQLLQLIDHDKEDLQFENTRQTKSFRNQLKLDLVPYNVYSKEFKPTKSLVVFYNNQGQQQIWTQLKYISINTFYISAGLETLLLVIALISTLLFAWRLYHAPLISAYGVRLVIFKLIMISLLLAQQWIQLSPNSQARFVLKVINGALVYAGLLFVMESNHLFKILVGFVISATWLTYQFEGISKFIEQVLLVALSALLFFTSLRSQESRFSRERILLASVILVLYSAANYLVYAYHTGFYHFLDAYVVALGLTFLKPIRAEDPNDQKEHIELIEDTSGKANMSEDNNDNIQAESDKNLKQESAPSIHDP